MSRSPHPRLPSRLEAITEALRRRIREGASYAPGSRLPTHRELEREHRAGRKTVEGALAALVRDGFVEARGRAGTFVVDAPPHLARYALVFPFQAGASGWTQFHEALRREARAYRDAAARRIVCYYGGGEPGTIRYGGLLDDVRAGRLAGVIHTPTADMFEGTPLSRTGDMPQSMIGGSGPARILMELDYGSLAEQAVADLRARGRRRIAFVLLGGAAAWAEALIRPVLRAQGLAYEPRWVQSIAPGWADHAFALLLGGARDARPDGLVLMDDHLLPEAAGALTRLKLRVPRDLAVVAHANLPRPSPCKQPFTRVGFDLRRLLRIALDRLDAERHGAGGPTRIRIPAVAAGESAR